MKESLIENSVCSYSKSLKWWPIKLSGMWATGLPDRMFLKCGQIFFIEFKQKNKKLRKLQEYVCKKLVKYGFTVYVVDSIDKGKKIIEKEEKKLKSILL